LLWNIPFNGLGVAGAAGYEAVVRGQLPAEDFVLGPCLPTDALLGEPRWLALVTELMREVLAVADRLGFEIPVQAIETRIERTRRMGAYKASTLVDFERGQPLELESLFLAPLRCAREAGVATPRLAALCDLLVELYAVKKVAVG
jgi:2-dehydropantoate 2-reductase